MANSKDKSSFLDIKPQQLNQFINKNLQPDEGFLKDCCKNMDLLADYLKTQSGFSVSETIKGGSLGKATALKGQSDLDVVFYLSGKFKDMPEFTKKVPSVIGQLERAIKAWSQQRRGRGRVEVEGTTSSAFKIKLRYGKEDSTDFVDVDLWPAYDLLKLGKTIAYQKMQDLSLQEKQLFSGSLVPLQLEFVTKQPTNVKNLIRLIKYWRKIMFKERSEGLLLPTSYVFELLTIYAWEQAGRPTDFDTAKGFMAVLKILKDFQHIDVSWGVNYSRETYRTTPTKRPFQPYILDPANPFNNVCAMFGSWPEVSKVADESLKRPLLKGIHILRRGKNHHGYSWN